MQSLPFAGRAFEFAGRAFEAQTGRVICEPCREQHHEDCRGGSWCCCQHRPEGPVEPATGPPGE